MPTDLDSDEQEILQRVVRDHSPELASLLPVIGRRQLTSKEREDLRGALADELAAAGLDSAYEPTDYGRKIDGLIGLLSAF
jgi:hypothetical protein